MSPHLPPPNTFRIWGRCPKDGGGYLRRKNSGESNSRALRYTIVVAAYGGKINERGLIEQSDVCSLKSNSGARVNAFPTVSYTCASGRPRESDLFQAVFIIHYP